jgi:uncharacterized membrane protein
MPETAFRVVAIEPFECYREAWRRIRDQYWSFSLLLIVDKKLAGLDAVKLGAQAAWRNVGGMVGLSLLGAVMGLAGVCCCYVGALFVLPISLGAIVAAYDRVFGIAAAVGSTPGMPAVP